MGPKLDPKVESVIIAFSKDGWSYGQIVTKLKNQNITVSKSAVSKVIRNIGKHRRAKLQGLSSPKRNCQPKVLTPAIRRKIDLLTRAENPLSQREIARQVGVSRTTVQRVVRDLNKVIKRKTRVHRLLPRHLKNRKTNCRKFYERSLAGQRSEFVVTLDEALFGLHCCNGNRKICYVKKGEPIPENWVVNKDNFFKTFMVVAAISGRGRLPLIRVPKKVKVNANYCVAYVLRPYLETHLPSLYGTDISKLTVHHNAASSHTAKKTQAYAAEVENRLGVKIIKNSDIPVKSPDVSPLDFFGFGYLKRRIFRRRPKTMGGVWKLLQEEWSKIDQNLIDKTFASWKRRLRAVSRRHGAHIENIKNIHGRYQ